MLKLKFNKNTYQVPDRWEELSQNQFLQTLEAVTNLFNGKIDLFQFRIMMALIVTGLKPRRIRSTEKEMLMSENLYRIGSEITFPLVVKYKNRKAFSRMKKAVREKLGRYLPEEITEDLPEKRWGEKAEKKVEPDFVFAANLVPEIRVRRKKLQGFTFHLDGNMLVTSLTAGQYIEAQSAWAEAAQTGDSSMLRLMAAVLYSPGKYKSADVLALSRLLAGVSLQVLNAVFVNFQAIQEFISTGTKYSLLYKDSGQKMSKNAVTGLESAAYSLIRSGVKKPERMNLMKFLDLLYNDVVTSVTELHRQEMPLDKISEKTGLSISKINQVL